MARMTPLSTGLASASSSYCYQQGQRGKKQNTQKMYTRMCQQLKWSDKNCDNGQKPNNDVDVCIDVRQLIDELNERDLVVATA